ncbi:ATP-binding protein [Candidatus Accumulibacter sp. ACC003]|uniref:ATP-binding protein n=1 Tax=Candidatus Accumulibacter sp. ACC003 TaxID=2823334 RepID=UPI0025C201BC|nr:ATP-binding protein [Candidatus Accumulibacter sp. ACC003]
MAFAEISVSGRLISANDGLHVLLQRSSGEVVDDVAPYFSNPNFAELVASFERAAPGDILHQGLLTFLDELGEPHSLLARVFRHGDHLALLAEHDVGENQRLLATVLGLNDELAEQQRVLARANRQLAAEKAEQRRLLQELAAAQAHLVQSAQLASVGQLAAGVAHEINNPIGFVRANLTTLGSYVDDLLSVVDAYAAGEALLASDAALLAGIEALRARCDLDFVRADAPELVAESAAGIARVARIVSDLKDFSRINESEWQVTDLHACLESTLNVASHALQKVVVVREYGALPALYCCPSQLNQAFMNLLVNAIQSLDGSRPGQIFLRSGVVGDQGWIEIEDNGQGIAAANLARIFDPFYSTRAIGAGTRLGLSSAWGIVSGHGGRIEVRSEPGVGSCFRVWLPLSRTAVST